MAIKAKNTITLVRTDDGLPAYVHQAWANSPDGTVDFTTVYPRENLLNVNIPIIRSNNSGLYPITSEILTDDSGTFTRFKRNKIELNPNKLSLYSYMPRASFYDASKLDGKTVVVSYDVRASIEMTATMMAICVWSDGSENKFAASGKKVNITKDWQRQFVIGTVQPSFTEIRVNPQDFLNMTTFDGVYVDFKNYKVEIIGKTEPTVAPPYTPSPIDDPIGAYPKYMGTCSNHSETAPTDPSAYEWARVLGAPGGEGKPGENGKEVISGYLSNESFVLPANASGAVSDFSKATGKFVVYEGQTQKTSGVTYAVTSQIGLTATIDASGTYKVTALSADLGTAIFKATYSGVSIEKILIATKAKQGPNGATGATGPTGATGATGPTGPQGPPTGITESTTIPTDPYVGMLWKNTGDNTGYLSDVTYRWNGSRWDIYTFVAENISASTLSAICANLGTVTAGTINGVNINGSVIKNTFKNWETGIEFGSAGSGLYLGGTTTIRGGRVKIESKLHNKSGVQISPLQMFISTLGEEGIEYGTYDESGAKTLMQMMAGGLAVSDLTGSTPRSAVLTVDDIIKLKNFNEKTKVIFDAGYDYNKMPYPRETQKYALGDITKIKWIIINWAMYNPSTGASQGAHEQTVLEYSSTSAAGSYRIVLPYDEKDGNSAAEMTIKRIRFPFENGTTYLQGDAVNSGKFSKWWLMRKVIIVEG